MSFAIFYLEEVMSAIRKSEFPDELYPVQLEGEPMAETQLYINQILYLISALETFFQNEPVLVLGDMTFYYEQGNPKKFIVPDVFVVKNVEKEPPRRVFRLWEERVPEVVFEISSRETWGADLNKKWELYQGLGVREYYIFDPEYDYLPEPLVAYQLNDEGKFDQIAVENGRVFSAALGLELIDTGEGLRFFNPATKRFLLTMREAFEEIERLRAEIAQLKSPTK